MKIATNLLVSLAFALALFVVCQTFKIPHKEYYNNENDYIFTKGNALPELRQEIINQLQLFQKGYEARDTSDLNQFMVQLFSKENILILGTMPDEIYSGYIEASDLVSSDWLYWGDVKLLVNNSNISAKQDVAWISTIGFVEFDLSRFLVLPLRLTGIMVKEDQTWKFQQVQFQFDLDNLKILISIILLSIMLTLSILRLLFVIYKVSKKTKATS